MKSTWMEVKLNEICSMKYGKMPLQSDLFEEGYPVFSGYRIVGYHKEYLYEEREIVVVARGVGGTGHQSSVIIHLYRQLGELTGGHTLFLFEEPDNHLHPPTR